MSIDKKVKEFEEKPELDIDELIRATRIRYDPRRDPPSYPEDDKKERKKYYMGIGSDYHL